jgi:ribosomal protein S27AE
MSTKAQRDALDKALATFLLNGTQSEVVRHTVRLDPRAGRSPYLRGDLDRAIRSEIEQIRNERARAEYAARVADRTCERCGNAYVADRSDSRYCSGRCRVAAFRDRGKAPAVTDVKESPASAVTGTQRSEPGPGYDAFRLWSRRRHGTELRGGPEAP